MSFKVVKPTLTLLCVKPTLRILIKEALKLSSFKYKAGIKVSFRKSIGSVKLLTETFTTAFH